MHAAWLGGRVRAVKTTVTVSRLAYMMRQAAESGPHTQTDPGFDGRAARAFGWPNPNKWGNGLNEIGKEPPPPSEVLRAYRSWRNGVSK